MGYAVSWLILGSILALGFVWAVRDQAKKARQQPQQRPRSPWAPASPVACGDRALYLMQSGSAGPVKVGIAADVEQRRRQLQTGSAERIHVRRVIPSASDYERPLHAQFARHRMSGEWFAVEALPTILGAFDRVERELGRNPR
ncbi:GIY-YIG nuclease family protein [Leekyejoonella antrihumi]|uniref:GIY-YIG nuclease family protein n=1 Tax=Leekyejoonella antrihumi TaxID=1660198 RepID=A0A563E5W8_9MICO|nr:GIY-YIG nuclease family protein [Leekyejoonella antrihumi]TWP37958.1 GIY-YIG nuclease family protein [Leekyejoonella antrihumi]